MAFRTNKVPAIEERTVSGSSVSFNSAFALPLKACKVSFSATQAGSGEPSPSNPRAISGVSAIGLNANSTPVSVSLGDTRYGGELDVLTGELTVDRKYKKATDMVWVGYSYNQVYTKADTDNSVTTEYPTGRRPIICNRYEYSDSNAIIPINACGWGGATNNKNLFVRDSVNTTSLSVWTDYIANNEVEFVYYIEPIVIQLSANELSSIIGNNTFSTDTGTLEITFADLQEKSASGSVATFNTALAMPLASCNIAVNAWQEGSGDPSPDNVRPIHGFNVLNATRAGKNLFDNSSVTWNKQRLRNDNGNIETALISQYSSEYPVKPNTTYSVSGMYSTNARYRMYYLNFSKGWISRTSAIDTETFTFTTPSNCYYVEFQCDTTYDGSSIQLEAGSTATAYEHYVTPTIYTIQLGQEVYGAEVDVLTGQLVITDYVVILNGSENGWSWYEALKQCSIALPYKALYNVDVITGYTSNYLTPIANGMRPASINNYCSLVSSGNSVALSTPANTLEDAKTWLSTHNVTFKYRLETPITIQLTPQQIETLIGNNTIFADTGDVDLTFKDLDIAKRGNFREVFKLPS